MVTVCGREKMLDSMVDAATSPDHFLANVGCYESDQIANPMTIRLVF